MAFTYDIAYRNRNFNTQGKLLIDETARYEVVFVEGLPYRRQIEQDGKQLAGKAAREEIERYQRAFEERSRMTIDQKRSYLRRKHHVDIPLPLIPRLFTSSMVGAEQVDGRGTFVIDCKPREDVHPSDEEERRALRKRVRLWIDRNDQIVSHMEATLIEDDAGFDKGTTARIDFSEVEGVWLPVRSDVEFQARDRLEKIRGETEETNSRFKKFHVDVRLLDGGEVAHDCGPAR